MSVYVGEMFACLPNKNWRYNQAAHLFADNLDELHLLASKIGLKRSWFQPHAIVPHYDLTTSKRTQALAAGAIAVDLRSEGRYIQQCRPNKLRKEPQYES